MRINLPVIITLFSSIVLRVFLVFRDSVPFAYDMGRDLLYAKDIAFYHNPTLIGPAASIWGVYFGPFWFYFLSIPILISQHPYSAVFASASTIIATGALGYFLFKKYLTPLYALAFSIIILFNATTINISTFAFHANLLPILTLLLIYFCFLSVIKNPLFLSGAFFTASLMFHADPAPAVAFSFVPPAVFIAYKMHRSKHLLKTAAASVFAYTLPFIPHILFELRNNFTQTKSLLAYFSGSNPSLSGQLPLADRITNRISIFVDFISATFIKSNKFFTFALIVFVAIGLYRFHKTKKDKNLKVLFWICVLTFVLTYAIYTVAITVEIKNWYLHSYTVIFALFLTFALISFKKYKLLLPIFLIVFIFVNVYPLLNVQSKRSAISDPANLKNQLNAVESIYQDSKSQKFSVYVFTPSIYDYNYQYLFWWYGQKRNYGLPQEFSYLPNQPKYVYGKDEYQNTPGKSDLIYLIVEQSQQNPFYKKEEWFKKFEGYNTVWQHEINGAITVQKRQK